MSESSTDRNGGDPKNAPGWRRLRLGAAVGLALAIATPVLAAATATVTIATLALLRRGTRSAACPERAGPARRGRA